MDSVETYTVAGVTGNYLTLTVSRRNDSTDLEYSVEFTSNLSGPWVANGTLISTGPGSGGTLVETWRAPTSIGMLPTQFGRLRVIKR